MEWAIIAELVAAFLIVDFCSGVVHWFEDQYGSLRMPRWAVENIVKPNRLHHIYPRAVVHCPRWVSVIQGVGPALVFFPFTVLLVGWRMSSFALVLAALPNFVHKWNHQRESERPAFVNVLQRFHVLQSPRHHHGHHIGRSDVAYCVVTPLLNLILDRIRFWRRLEALIRFATGIEANSPDEPLLYYRVEAGRIMEFRFENQTWVEWPHFERYQRPVR